MAILSSSKDEEQGMSGGGASRNLSSRASPQESEKVGLGLDRKES